MLKKYNGSRKYWNTFQGKFVWILGDIDKIRNHLVANPIYRMCGEVEIFWNFINTIVWGTTIAFKLVKFDTNPKMYIEVTKHVSQTYV